MSTAHSVFPHAGWEMVYDLRAAVRDGDVDAVSALVGQVDVEQARQLGMMAPTLLAQYTGTHPSPETIRLTARTLHRHLARFDTRHALTVNHVVDILVPLLAGNPLPDWVDRPVILATLVGFLMPDGAAEDRLRDDLEPVWAGAMES
ncbi:hypothetical protein GOPIP_092_00230 [Gordonia polyisoprenivorans NBRC 16320 = JCM 10675]|uniref:Uncharacterized protein n=1 Tax=Gordonia polyisoprenivorans TaxID=84595 RepID=A0A846WQZ2_9ACTN|nr:hypothetical protein [Gordonia polyisoprenivorans]NKY04068.1 hypothetical protein [Gordonia polyisoprenivorans]GAB26105.1 hypothetical protein GOPIP_092_00230 [Gordonia polyisoprenivorans NBRC 16320 = JCM 10675]